MFSLLVVNLAAADGRAILQEFREQFKQILHEEVALGIREFASSRRASRASTDATQRGKSKERL